MLTSQFVTSVSIFLVYTGLNIVTPLLSRILIFLLFLWAIPTFGLSQGGQWVFYSLAFLFGLYLMDKTGLQTESDRVDINGQKQGGLLRGVTYHIFTIGIGIFLIFIIHVISSSKGQFLGVAALSMAATDSFLANLQLTLAPAMSGALRIIENLLILGVMKALIIDGKFIVQGLMFMLKLLVMIPFIGWVFAIPIAFFSMLFGVLIPVTPFLLAAIIFGMFHLAVYKVLISLIIWASMIMILWIVSYYLTGQDSTAMDTSHYGWNAWQTMKESTTFAVSKAAPMVGG